MSGTILTRDGEAVWAGPTRDALGAALRLVPCSWDHATTCEGYAEHQAERWELEQTLEQTRTAWRILRDHGHDGYNDDLTRASCGACALAGFGADENGPNYAGWARIYVQARRPVPEVWRAAFLAELNTADNDRYRDALRRDVLTYGVTFTRAQVTA